MAQMPTTGISDRPLDVGQSSAGTGMEWIVDARECDADSLRDLELVGRLCERVIADLGLRVLGAPLKHQFPHPGGVTALYMLSESHLACHTYPEFGTATFNLYCCRARSPWDWDRNLKSAFGSARVEIKRIARGA